MNRTWVRPCLCLLLLCPASIGPAVSSPPDTLVTQLGVVVEDVMEGFVAHQAGLQAGDVLLRWERAASPPANPEPASGDLDSPFGLLEVEIEQAPRGELTVSGTRGGERLLVRLTPGIWKLRTRPQLNGAELEAYEKARALIGKEEIDKGWSVWMEMATVAGESGDHKMASWLFLRIAETAGETGDWEIAEGAFEEARREAKASGEASALLTVTGSLARSFEKRNDLERAAAAYDGALEIRQASSSMSLGIAKSFYSLGLIAWKRGDLATATAGFRRALAMQEKLAPQSLDTAASVRRLGIVAGMRGDLVTARAYIRRSLTIQEKLAPRSPDVARSLMNLGSVAWVRGDLASAEAYFRRALTLQKELVPQTVDVAGSLNNLGNVARARGDSASAQAYYRRGLAIVEKLAPQSLDVAANLNNLGVAARDQGDLAAAEAFYRRSLAITEKLAPQSLNVAASLNNLASIALARKSLVSAEGYLRRSLAIYEKSAPRSADTANTLVLLGDVALARSDWDAAEAHYELSLAARRERAPGSADEAQSCQRLAALHRRRHQADRALALYDCAVEALEAQRGKLGGSDEARSGFGAMHAGTYREAIDLLVEVGKEQEAFHLLERYRAQELLALLAARALVFSSDIPEELESRRRLANRSYDQAFGQWMRLSERAGAEERQKAREKLEQVRRQQAEIRAEIRAAAPRLAALRDPRPLDLSATRAALDPGTLLLSYSLGKERSYLFAVESGKGELRVFPLAVSEESLRDEVERFREVLGRGSFDRRPEKALLHARQLSGHLLAPASTLIEQADRLLILADGPLHSMPFAALADPGAMDGRRFLIEAKPIHLAASATVFALLKQERRDRQTIRLTAFGDPQYPADARRGEDAAPQMHAALRSGFDLAPLPATRGEVESLRKLYPQASQVYLGAEATEERAKAVGQQTTHLHIASHGLLDDRFPLDSALAFSIPSRWQDGEDNGLLQAWEIFEQVRLDADLVTLSACGTGLGKVLGGEGLLGLTRAFQYAGARSVLASLWSVSDASTGELMSRFYGYLKKGQSKAEALRGAQLDLLQDSDFSHPFHWAGFELVGDWR